MTLSDIVNAPDEDTLVFDGERLPELLECLSEVKCNATDAATALRMEGVTRVTISPVKALLPSKAAFVAFLANNTDAPCGYAFGREWFYQNAAGNAPSLVTK